MHEFRVAIGLLACTGAWLAVTPAAPTLISFSASSASPVQIGSADASAAPPATVSNEVGATAPEVVPAVRATPAAVAPPVAATPPNRSAPQQVAVAKPETNGRVEFQLFNRPVAVDAGTLKAGRTTLRVADIEPISPDARCSDGTQTWPCGIRARTAFRSWLRGRSVLCAVPADRKDAADLTVSCLAGEADIGEWLVANGWAMPTGSQRYGDLAETAKAERRGVYAYGVTP